MLGTGNHWWYSRTVSPSWSLLSSSGKRGFPGGSDDKESACNAEEQSSIPGLGRSPGEGNGYPLQSSCLENPMDRGAWRATVHGVQSQTQLSNWHTHSAVITLPPWWWLLGGEASGAPPGSGPGGLARSTDLLGLWPRHSCWLRGTNCRRRCCASFLRSAALAWSPRKQPLLPAPLLSGWKMKQSIWFSCSVAKLLIYRRAQTASFLLHWFGTNSALVPLPSRPPPPRQVSITQCWATEITELPSLFSFIHLAQLESLARECSQELLRLWISDLIIKRG